MPSKSKQQQKFMGMAHALKKGEMKSSDASPELKRVAKSMSDKDVKDFASTSHKGLPRKVKQEILHKLKEYANKMGRDHLGGDSIPSAKKGGLRDFDGYDNVDYNKDMPMDEVSSSDAYKISRMLGTGQQSTQDFIEDNKIDVKKLESYIKKLSPSKKIIIKDIINGSTDKRLSTIKKGLVKQVKESLDESINEFMMPRDVDSAMKEMGINKIPISSQGERVLKGMVKEKFLDKVTNKERLIYFVESLGKEKFGYGTKGKPLSKLVDRFWNDITSDGIFFGGKMAAYQVAMHMKDMKANGEEIDSPYEMMKEYFKNFGLDYSGSRVFNSAIRNLEEWMKRNKIQESLDEAVDKDDLKNAKNRLKDPHTIEDIEYRKTNKGDKFVKIIYKKKYVTGKMMDTGPHFVSVFYNDEKDLQNIGKALKLKLKESLDESMMSTLDQIKKDSKNIRDFIKKVLSDKDFRDMKGDKDFIKYLGSMYEGVTEGGIPQNWMQGRTSDYHTKLRGKDREYDDTNFDKENSGQEDLEEYGQRLDLSYLEDEEARLDGTPKPKDAIDKDLEEQTLNELGVFPIRAFLQDMIPGNLLKTTTPQDKERLKSTIKDLIITLNKFWKQNNIPYRVREK